MKSNSIVSILMMIAIIAFTFTACKKDKVEPVPVTPDPHTHDHGDVALKFNHMIGDDLVEFNQVYNLNGLEVTFTRIQYYLHDISFYPGHSLNDGVTLNGKYLLVNGNGQYNLGDVELAHLHGLRFKIGVDQASNSITSEQFAALEASNPLSAQNPSMHWSWATGSGYKFAAFEGTFNNGANTFVYHVATDALLRQGFMISTHMDNDHDNVTVIDLKVDLAAIFTGVDIAANSTQHGAGGVNPTIMDNIVGAFSKIQ